MSFFAKGIIVSRASEPDYTICESNYKESLVSDYQIKPKGALNDSRRKKTEVLQMYDPYYKEGLGTPIDAPAFPRKCVRVSSCGTLQVKRKAGGTCAR